ncbi:hypothetical protein [Acidithiobacillus sp.]
MTAAERLARYEDPFAAIPLPLRAIGGLNPMCLSPEQIAQIRQSAAESFGPAAKVATARRSP